MALAPTTQELDRRHDPDRPDAAHAPARHPPVREGDGMRALSHRTLRRLAWGVWWFVLAVTFSGLVLLLVHHQAGADSWGGGGVAAGV